MSFSSLPSHNGIYATNYSSWKVDMRVLLLDRGCWDFITGQAELLAPDATERERRGNEWRKNKAYTTIYLGIERQFQPLIANTLNGEEAWNILKEHLEPTSRARLAGLIDEFYDIRFEQEKETIGIFCKRVEEQRRLIEDAGFKMPEILTCFQLIRRLPVEYDNIVQVLYRLEDDQFTIRNIELQLVNESSRVVQKRKDEGLTEVTDAYLIRTRNNVAIKY